MALNKLLGYILCLVGLAGALLFAVPQLKSQLPFKIPEGITDPILIIIAIVVLLVGVFLIRSGTGGGKQPKEVPIFQGKNVVGFRRLRK
jgi:hypothetical protein